MADNVAAISTTVEKTNRILSMIEKEMQWRDRPDQALSALRVVLHVLRDRLPVNEAVHFGAQLPELVRGIYYEGWTPSKVPVKMNREEFLEEVRRNFIYARDQEMDIEHVIRVVIGAVSEHLDRAELEKVRASLPKSMSDLLAA